MNNKLRVVLVLFLFLGSASLFASPAADLPPQETAEAAESAAAETASPLMRTVFDSQKRNVSCWSDCHDIFVDCRDGCGADSGCIGQCFEDQMDCRDLC